MHRPGTTRRSMILADGYSYTEIIPAPQPAGVGPGPAFVVIFHALFHPNDADQPVASRPASALLSTADEA